MKHGFLRRMAAVLLCCLLLAPLQVFAEDRSAVVCVDEAPLRVHAGTNSGVVTTLHRGDAVTVTSTPEPGEDGGSFSWYYVLFNDDGNYQSGYLREDQLRFEGGEGPGTLEHGKAQISLSGTAFAGPGESVFVTLSVSSASTIGSWLIELSYDDTILTYVSGADNVLPGRLLFCNVYDNGITSVSADLVFTAAGNGETALTVVSSEIISFDDYTEMETNTASFSVSVNTPHDHVWGEVYYAWEDDHSCTASHNCQICNFREWDTAVPEDVLTREASCTVPAAAIYTVSFFVEDFETQTLVVETGPALGHSWGEVTYTWSDDNTTCTATRACAACGETENETVNVSEAITKTATQTEEGQKTYTAVFERGIFEDQTKTETIPRVVVWGDANGDGAVNNKDIVRLKNYLANLDEETGISSNGTAIYEISPGANANGDGKVDNKDIVRLKNYVANYDDATGVSSNGTTEFILGPAV